MLLKTVLFRAIKYSFIHINFFLGIMVIVTKTENTT